jgi:hypothetical protein
MKEIWCSFSVMAAAGEVVRRRANFFFVCGTWIAIFPIRDYAYVPFPFLKLNTCSSRFMSLATSFSALNFLLTMSLFDPFLHYPSSFAV